MTGWKLITRYVGYMCEKRNIAVPDMKCPDFSDFPILEDGARGVYDRWFSGSETKRELFSLLHTPLGNNTFAFAVANEDGLPERLYLKICEFAEPCMGHEYNGAGMDEPVIHYDIEDVDEIRAWCRVSLKRPEYITGSDECMTLNESQKQLLNEAVRNGWSEIVHDYNSFVVYGKDESDLISTEDNLPDYTLLPTD